MLSLIQISAMAFWDFEKSDLHRKQRTVWAICCRGRRAALSCCFRETGRLVTVSVMLKGEAVRARGSLQCLAKSVLICLNLLALVDLDNAPVAPAQECC